MRPTGDRGSRPWSRAGYEVYAINPLSVARYRERHSTSRAKSDMADAHLLAEMVRVDRAAHRPVAGDTDAAEAVKLAARHHQTLVWERTRHLLRLRSALRDFFPAALLVFDDLDAPDALELLALAPDPDRAAKLTRRQVVAALRRAHRRDVEERATTILAVLRGEELRRAPQVQGAYAAVVASQAASIRIMCGSPEPIPQPVGAGAGCLDRPVHRHDTCATPDLDANVGAAARSRPNSFGILNLRGRQGKRDEWIYGLGGGFRRVLAQPAMDDVGVDAVGQGHRCNRCAVRPALRHDLRFECRAVIAPLRRWCVRLARHGVHDLHRAHDACLNGLSQYGFTGRIPLNCARRSKSISAGSASWTAFTAGAVSTALALPPTPGWSIQRSSASVSAATYSGLVR